jgi:deoxyribonuclease-4
MGRIGAHVSTAGGAVKAFERGAAMGCESLQIFVKSPNQWRAKALAAEDVTAFKAEHTSSGLPVTAHAAYLINLASPKEDALTASIAGLTDELDRCDTLGLGGLVVHPGGHLGSGVMTGIESIARSINTILASRPPGSTLLLLENTAGQGTSLGGRFEELGAMLKLIDEKERMGVCLDTCHAYSSGYDLVTPEGYEAMLEDFEREIGLSNLRCMHINDSKHPLGSHKDRHENIGEGLIGEQAFARLLNDKRLADIPMILETPVGDDELGHARDMDRLRSLRA